jgi:hypothetical protein
VYPYPVENGYPYSVVKPSFDRNFERLVDGGMVFDNNNDTVTRTYTKEYKPFAEVAADFAVRVDNFRRTTLDKFQRRSVGVSRVYAENLRATDLFLAGNGSDPMPTGDTVEEYLATLGAPLGMTAAQFAAYIRSENERLTPNAMEVERLYLVVKAALLSGSVPAVMATWYAFHGYCLTVATE